MTNYATPTALTTNVRRTSEATGRRGLLTAMTESASVTMNEEIYYFRIGREDGRTAIPRATVSSACTRWTVVTTRH